MPTRKSHNKTRLGCGQCKKRRVKCDGKHPACGSCRKRGLDCSFLLLVPTSKLSAAGTLPSTQPTITTASDTNPTTPYGIQIFRQISRSAKTLSPRTPNTLCDTIFANPLVLPRYVLSVDAWSANNDDLKPYHRLLLNHYSDSTSLTLATDSPGKSAWQCFVPGLASKHKFLVHGALAVASLHLARLYDGKEERDKMNRTAADQMNRAISHFKGELDHITKNNALALFAHATLTAVYFFRTSIMEMDEIRASIPVGVTEPPAEHIDKLIQSFIKTFWGLRGACNVLGPGWNWVVGSELSSVATRRWWPKHRVPANDRARDEDKQLADLEELWMSPERPYEKHFKCLSEALRHLRSGFALVSLLTDTEKELPSMNTPIPYSVDDTTVGMLRDRAAIFVWATQITQEFIGLFEQKNTEAMVIVAHHAVLFGRIRSVWWLEGLGAHAIWAIAMALGPEKRHLIEWPAQAVGLSLDESWR